jgi:hypothetical protein
MENPQDNQPRPRTSPAPNWTAIFTLREDLRPPGYDELFLEIIEKPYVKPKTRQEEDAKKKKQKKKLGRNQTI